jgi:hypothetical protein
MRTLVTVVGATLLCSGPVRAQGTQTWTGVLVAATCETNSADRVSDMTAAKKTSAHETSTTYEESVNQSDRNSVSSSAASSTAPPAGAHADNCRISDSTSSYALRLADGRLLRFDDAGNAKIRQRLQSKQTKTGRVDVKGKMQGDTIKLDSIHI